MIRFVRFFGEAGAIKNKFVRAAPGSARGIRAFSASRAALETLSFYAAN